MILDFLAKNNLTLCCAESCTGGMIGEMITSQQGQSKYFLGSAVTYSNESKSKILGVPESVIEKHGQVSEETAKLMAEGARKVFGADISIAVTGIAGPSGGSETKPIGTVFIAVQNDKETIVKKFLFEGDREKIRKNTADKAIGFLLSLYDV